MIFDTPILLMIFNRPDTTRQVFEAIRKARPTKLFVAADGPRPERPGEKERCEEARTIINNVDWPCEVKTLFQEKNLSCRFGPPTAISWFFDNVEEGIILEDDCLPDPAFFPFCQELLRYYRDDKRVMQIAGSNFQLGQPRGDGSYYFSKFNHLWGWASWRRAWALNDFNMSTFPKFKEQNVIASVWENKKAQRSWLRTLEKMHQGKLNTWDYPWTMSFWAQSGLCALPNVNLIKNIGFGDEATHTKKITPKLEKLNLIGIEELGQLKHPTFVAQNKEADNFTYDQIYRTPFLKKVVIRLSFLFNKFKNGH
ncbi:MAG: glycosyltransferase family 2 protein [Candidatus Paceibacterota bacterium]|jgi:hypothetical protein